MSTASMYTNVPLPDASSYLESSTSERDVDLSSIWNDLVAGRLEIQGECIDPTHTTLVLRERSAPHEGCGPCGLQVLVRILTGESRKVIAAESRVSASTVSTRFKSGLAELGLPPARVPLAVVIAAQTQRSGVRFDRARCSVLEASGARLQWIRVPLPSLAGAAGLTAAQRAVARMLIEGCTRSEIARRRSTSEHTVGCQLARLSSATRTSGRYDLVRYLIERDIW
jgi:DNA-binding NarL/FixJ family response regulator